MKLAILRALALLFLPIVGCNTVPEIDVAEAETALINGYNAELQQSGIPARAVSASLVKESSSKCSGFITLSNGVKLQASVVSDDKKLIWSVEP
ncbi:MAG TPA: hypothetical protein VGB77_22235 [Abditibacteriaceae bacterium]|jgi:hypothetical protein